MISGFAFEFFSIVGRFNIIETKNFEYLIKDILFKPFHCKNFIILNKLIANIMSFSKESMKWAALGLGAVAAAGIAIYMASPRVGGDDDPSKDDGKKEEEKKEESVPAKEPPVVGDKYITYGDDKTN